MNPSSATRALVRSLPLAALLCLPAAGSANDYYSWIDSNGTIMMTDDPSRVPPATGRSQIQVHRFEPAQPAASAAHEPASVSRQDPPAARPEAVDPRDLNLPLVVLGEPDKHVGPQYVWVPLLSPLLLGGNSVSGFWWYPGATSPVEAFKQFLAQHYRQQQAQWMPGVGAPYSSQYPGTYVGYGRGPSGNIVFDQTVRERQALEESIRLRHFPNSAAPGPQAPRGGGGGGGGHHSVRSR
jgi:hypothetical protein